MKNNTLSIIGLLALGVALAGCTTPGGKASPGNGGAPSVGTTSKFVQPCKDFCQHARALQCPEGQPLPDGTSCEKFCTDTQDNGHALNTACMTQAKSCAALRDCP